MEIQEAQSQASLAQSTREAQMEQQQQQEQSGGRRSRHAAAAAKAALSMLNETDKRIDDVVFERPAPPGPVGATPGAARGRGGRGGGRGRGGGGGGRGRGAARRPAASAAAAASSYDSPAKRARTTTRTSELQAEDETALYFIIRNGKASLQQVVDDWIDNYKADRDNALLALMQFFISAAGCRGRITPYMQSSMEHADIIRQMTDEFEEESGEYPLVTPGE